MEIRDEVHRMLKERRRVLHRAHRPDVAARDAGLERIGGRFFDLRPRAAGRGDKAIYTKPTAAALPRPML